MCPRIPSSGARAPSGTMAFRRRIPRREYDSAANPFERTAPGPSFDEPLPECAGVAASYPAPTFAHGPMPAQGYEDYGPGSHLKIANDNTRLRDACYVPPSERCERISVAACGDALDQDQQSGAELEDWDWNGFSNGSYSSPRSEYRPGLYRLVEAAMCIPQAHPVQTTSHVLQLPWQGHSAYHEPAPRTRSTAIETVLPTSAYGPSPHHQSGSSMGPGISWSEGHAQAVNIRGPTHLNPATLVVHAQPVDGHSASAPDVRRSIFCNAHQIHLQALQAQDADYHEPSLTDQSTSESASPYREQSFLSDAMDDRRDVAQSEYDLERNSDR